MSDKDVKPKLSHPQVSELIGRLFGLRVSKIRPLPSYDDQNFHVAVSEGGEYVLKIMNSEDSRNLELLELQTHAMSFLHQRGLPAQTALPTVTGQLMSLEDVDCGSGTQKYLVRLLTYLPGCTISKVSYTPHILYQVGKQAATMDKVLQERQNFIWSLANVHLLEPYLPAMDGDPVQQVVKDVIELYKKEVLPNMDSFCKGTNHGDFNDLNILVEPDDGGSYRISGILDFGDMSSGCYVYELAITIMYMMIEHPNPLEAGGPVLAGWESVIPLNQAERDALYLLVLGRFCQSLVMAHHAVTLQPENKEYLMITARTGIRLLKQLWEMGKEATERKWFEAAREYIDRK
ncbi:hypothetical protein JZ751_025083 [Albula glossodonta]|uniref:Hydroxylysine kinase n=1 Tax=Albula glossodonta TaxID=121402 RepID=A0A8T2PCW2_9TELE|nr:hypothetical protein JZ751_025083 [Albula glossodonta]